MADKKINLTENQEKFLIKIRDLSLDKNCDFDCYFPTNLKSILREGYYTSTQQNTLNMYIIPRYKKYLKKIKK